MFTEGSSELPVLSVMVSVGINAFPMTGAGCPYRCTGAKITLAPANPGGGGSSGGADGGGSVGGGGTE